MRFLRRLAPGFPVLTVGLALALGTRLRSPDGDEMAAGGRCVLRLLVDPGACDGLDPYLWAPLFTVLSGALAAVIGVERAPLLTSILGLLLLAWTVTALARSLRGSGAALIAALALGAVPAVQVAGVAGEARSLALAMVFGAILALLRERALLAGALLGLAFLARTELIATAGMVLLWVLWQRRALLPRAALGVGLAVLPYVLAVSLWAGQPMLTARDWEGRGAAWMAVMPFHWPVGWAGVGGRDSPLRREMVQGDWAGGGVLDPAGMPGWLLEALPGSVPLWLGVAAVPGLVLLWREARATLTLLIFAILPVFPVAMVPQARDPFLPGNNLLPLLVGLVIAGAVGLSKAARMPRARWAVGLLFLALVPWSNARVALPEVRDDALVEAARWLARETPAGTRVGVSMESAPVVLLADRHRLPLPPHWGARAWLQGAEPEYVVESWMDDPWMSLALAALDPRLRPVHTVDRGDGGWVVVHAVLPLPEPAQSPTTAAEAMGELGRSPARAARARRSWRFADPAVAAAVAPRVLPRPRLEELAERTGLALDDVALQLFPGACPGCDRSRLQAALLQDLQDPDLGRSTEALNDLCFMGEEAPARAALTLPSPRARALGVVALAWVLPPSDALPLLDDLAVLDGVSDEHRRLPMIAALELARLQAPARDARLSALEGAYGRSAEGLMVGWSRALLRGQTEGWRWSPGERTPP